jgi:hypothetical protein
MSILARNKVRYQGAGLPYMHRAPGDMDKLQVMVRAGIITEVRDELSTFPFDEMSNSAPSISPDYFMEELMNNVRNEVMSFQSFIKKGKNSTIELMKKQLLVLKGDTVTNQGAISELEKRLNIIVDNACRDELEKHHLFEILNYEKITPAFIKLSKSSYTDALLSDIKGIDGGEFNSLSEQKEYIFEYFSKVYKCSENRIEDYDGVIEEFLGPEILSNRVVIDSKLREEEQNLFEGDLTLEELDDSVKEANKSACGSDGITNCFIKRFWYIFRSAVYNYSIHCCSI